ncbi:754_t:CDS:2, partial [Cetraspora pellucida]
MHHKKKYNKEIAIEGSNTVLGLEEHLDKIVADLIGVELEIIKIARQWCAVIERTAITDEFDEARRSQVFESICYLRRVAYIEIIKEPHGKTRAEVNFFPNSINTKDLAKTWCLPFMKDYLVRVTIGKCNLDELKAHNTHNKNLFNLPENTNEQQQKKCYTKEKEEKTENSETNIGKKRKTSYNTKSDDDEVLNSKNSAKEYQQK